MLIFQGSTAKNLVFPEALATEELVTKCPRAPRESVHELQGAQEAFEILHVGAPVHFLCKEIDHFIQFITKLRITSLKGGSSTGK